MIKKIKNLAIKKAKFIIIPKPFENELFSSWLTRTAYAHNTHPHTFISLHLNFTVSHKNIDTCFSNEMINEISNKCSNKIDILKLTLKPYSGYLQENIINNGLNKLLCHQRFCPICLREDKIVYFRKQWKIIFNTVCEKHKCFLYDKCPKCNTRIDITKMFNNKFSFKFCHKCGFDLSKSRKISISNNMKHGFKTIKNLNRILNKGYIILGEYFIYSFYFFDSLLQIGKKILKHKKVLGVDKRYLFRYLRFRKYSVSQPVYHQISIKEQYALFSLAFYIFEKFPQNLKNYIIENRLSHWSILRDMDYSAFWFENIINKLTPRVIPISKFLTKEEIKNGKKYLKLKRMIINKANMSRLFGCSFFSVYNRLEL